MVLMQATDHETAQAASMTLWQLPRYHAWNEVCATLHQNATCRMPDSEAETAQSVLASGSLPTNPDRHQLMMDQRGTGASNGLAEQVWEMAVATKANLQDASSGWNTTRPLCSRTMKLGD